jgi:hypothetical protein
MTFSQLVDYWGSISEVARALGKSHSAVTDWRETGVPMGVQYQAQIASGMRLKADFPALRYRRPRKPAAPCRICGKPQREAPESTAIE